MASYQEAFDIQLKIKATFIEDFINFVFNLIHPCKVINNSKSKS